MSVYGYHAKRREKEQYDSLETKIWGLGVFVSIRSFKTLLGIDCIRITSIKKF
jgi:hypothetical protein